ncbi:MAG: ankyrin repeat domain-containing protein [Lysobacter sp.]|nr:ankyrin repeat domain-containing protein [Lysobacter sp.]
MKFPTRSPSHPSQQRIPAALLHDAIADKDSARVASLLADKIDPNGFFLGTPLETAISHGCVPEILNSLIKAGADVNAFNRFGLAPLHQAAHDHLAVAILIAEDADVNACCKHGTTPLHSAASSRAAHSVAAMVAAGSDVNATMKDGRTPLHLATKVLGDDIRYGGPERAQKLVDTVVELLKVGADPSLLDAEGRRADDVEDGHNEEERAVCARVRAVFAAHRLNSNLPPAATWAPPKAHAGQIDAACNSVGDMTAQDQQPMRQRARL